MQYWMSKLDVSKALAGKLDGRDARQASDLCTRTKDTSDITLKHLREQLLKQLQNVAQAERLSPAMIDGITDAQYNKAVNLMAKLDIPLPLQVQQAMVNREVNKHRNRGDIGVELLQKVCPWTPDLSDEDKLRQLFQPGDPRVCGLSTDDTQKTELFRMYMADALIGHLVHSGPDQRGSWWRR